ncbi:hypothetical protein [Candidatus Entotheonella palauensis]|uniref:Uncharacterized protein n=1 Tax=Candidatus Entotheonella gemina TaxID=1429439 RepID=W4MC88_9BACT|nr:hypothetical protein [Candidatus Entotheonella palauensis]ETX07252.1 MAG: hypothetical protein ETSY2_12305 [Candidatus Entotheonella gemina]
MWEAIDFPRLTDQPYPNVMAYVQALEQIYLNGSVEFSTFAIPEHPTFDWYCSRNAFHDMNFFQKFWSAPSVKQTFPFEPKADIDLSADDVFVCIEIATLGEALASALMYGGAYQLHAAGEMDANAKGEAAANELIGAHGDLVRVYACQMPWCDFFWDVLWDWTWVMINPAARRIHLLCTTDTD